jgi:trehalose 6-phosphate synthase/trehalose 6-phosphate phosphatase
MISYKAIVLCRERGESDAVQSILMSLAEIRSTSNTRLAIISESRAEQVRKLLGVRPSPEIWGCYGLQRLREDGREELFPISGQAREALCRAASLLEEQGLQQNTELRHGSLLVQWKTGGSPNAHEVSIRGRRVLEAVASGGAVILSRSADGMELRAPRAGKANAVGRMLDEFGQRGLIAYIGCDISDEECFRLMKGCGLGVSVRNERRQSSADLWLQSVEELQVFLFEWSRAARGQG